MRRSDHFWIKESLTAMPVALTLVAAGYVVYRNQMEPFPEKDLLVWILVILGLLALGEIIQRYVTLGSIDRKMTTLSAASEKLASGHLGDLFLKDRSEFPSFTDRMRSARVVWLYGTSIDALVTYHFGLFTTKAREGVSFRFLLMNPECSSVQARAYGLFSATPASLKGDIERSIEKITAIAGQDRSNVELRLTEFVPSHGMLLTDPTTNGGRIVVELYPYNISASERAHFELTREDAKWYAFYFSQFEALWRDAKEVARAQRA